jgi:cell division control protein 24
MADPLSIAGSVAGLLTLATSITASLAQFTSSVSDAPSSARAVLAMVEETKVTLQSVQHFIDSVELLPSRRKALIQLDHLAIVFSQCVERLSQLEALIQVPKRLSRKVKWVLDEKKIMRLMPHLESQKLSLSLIVSILRW